MTGILFAAASWLAASTGLGLLVGGGIRIADRRRPRS